MPLVDEIPFLSDAIEKYNYEKYSARLFDNGTFWEKDESLLDYKQGPYQKLLEGLLNAKKYLEQKKQLTQLTNNKTISKLLIMCVLVKYLEEKQDHNGTKLLEIYRDFYGQFQYAAEFTDILRKGLCVPFFEKLSSKFNGKVFELTNDEKIELKNANLEYVAAIFDANIDGNQYVLWELYSFNHLPIELISGIYEAFLSKEGVKPKDIVYTPPYLVNFLIDECMPLEKAEELFQDYNFKVLDPACGSGICLVSALKRMIQWAAIVHYKKTGQITYPDADVVRAIIRNNIFGVDTEQEATLITVFSLCIALCDKLSPMEIWDNLRFDNLSETNIVEDNFFNFFNKTSKQSFDLVIGNPPFNPRIGNNKQYAQFLSKEYNIQPIYPIHDANLAVIFWDKAIMLCKPGRNCCLILPSGAWLYNNSYEYRISFFESLPTGALLLILLI
ncbi:MAG: N-6 DNA methylase [Spirosomataceae bacterium]